MAEIINPKKIVGVFDSEDILIDSIEKLKDKGYRIYDVHSPFPLEGVFDMMKLKTRLPTAAFFYALFALVATFGFLYWTSVVNYPLVFGGKPQNTLSFVIVIFVMVINITALFTIITFFMRENKGPGAQPKIVHPGATDDKFVLIVDKELNMTPEEIHSAHSLLKENGALEVFEHENNL